MSGEGRGLDAYPERSVAIVRAFQRPLNRAVTAGAVIAIAIALVLVGMRVDEGFPGTIGIVLIGLIAGFGGLVVAIVVVPARVRRAFEAYSWLGHDEVRRFRERTGGPVPVGRTAMERWLSTTPSTPAMRLPRIELLAFLGRFDDARAELEAVPPIDGDVRFEIAALRQYIGWLEGEAADLGELREAARALAPGTTERRGADVTMAIVEARIRLLQGDARWSSSLETVRGELGWSPWRATLLDTWRPVGGLCMLVALITTVIGVVLRSIL